MVITCYKNYGTRRNSIGVPARRTRYALASEIGLRAGHACVFARSRQRGSKNNSGNWRCRMSWSAGCTFGGEVYWLIRVAKKPDAKICIMSPWFIKIGSRTSIVLFGAKTEPAANPRQETTHQTEHGPFGGCLHSTSSERQAKPSPV